MENSGLSEEHINKINTVFSKYPQIEKVFIYGSRAIGTYKAASDIDLALIGADLDFSLQLKIESALDDLLLPYKLDITCFEKINNPKLISHIKRVGKEFYKKV